MISLLDNSRRLCCLATLKKSSFTRLNSSSFSRAADALASLIRNNESVSRAPLGFNFGESKP